MSAISCQTGPERISLDPLRPDPWALHERNVKARPALREHGRKRPNKAFRLAKSFERIGRTTIPAGRSSARTYHRRRWPAPARLGHREIWRFRFCGGSPPARPVTLPRHDRLRTRLRVTRDPIFCMKCSNRSIRNWGLMCGKQWEIDTGRGVLARLIKRQYRRR